jgi:hypothetical protein
MTHQELLNIIHYDPETGTMYRKDLKQKPSVPIKFSTQLLINGINYQASKLAWFYVTGGLPSTPLFTLDGTTNLQFTNISKLIHLPESDITQELLHKYFIYDKDSGELIYKLRTSSHTSVGKVAGNIAGTLPDGGYKQLSLFGKVYPIHRIIWLYVYGSFPDKQIDHIDHNRVNNRISNLRLSTHHTNMKNKSRYVTNKTGYSGVNPHGNNWKARIGVNGTKVLLGVFPSFEEAVAARKAAEKLLAYHENHGLQNA